MLMDCKFAVETIAAIEHQCNVNAIEYRGCRIWPLIRVSLWEQLCHPQRTVMKVNKYSNSHSDRKNPLELAVNFFQQVYYDREQNQSLRKVSPVDVLFLSRIEDYTDWIDGKCLNRHIDPMIQVANSIPNINYLKLEIFNPKANSTFPRFLDTHFLTIDNKRIIEKLSQQEEISRKSDRIIHFQEVKEKVRQISSIDLIEEYFLNRIRLIQELEKQMFRALSILRPRIVFLVCYYCAPAMALISACKKLKIKTVDVQHGKQGKYHGMYTHWTKIPSDGYALLPDYFWSWGQESKDNITQWHPENCQHHQPIVGGNCWLGNWLKEGYPLAREEQLFLTQLAKYEKVIVVTLQPLIEMKEIFPEHLLEAIKYSPQTWFWLMRLHPRQKQSLPEMNQYLLQHLSENFEIENATNLPLYSLLKLSHHHITCWSSVCYEALLFQVPTTIIHPTGLQFYEEYINQGKFNYATSQNDLIDCISKNIDSKFVEEKHSYIETDLNLAEQNINNLLRSLEQNNSISLQ